MRFADKLKKFLKLYFFNHEWQCALCGEEKFNQGYLCDNCEKKLRYNDGPICEHCGRSVLVAGKVCSTCSEYMLSVDKARSVFSYEGEIRKLVKRFKYNDRVYLGEFFIEKLSLLYLKSYFNADYITFVPMTEKSKRNRGYNQSEILANGVSAKTGVKLIECVEKIKETKRQAKLNRKERLKNLDGVFRVINRKQIKEKTIVLVDDVTTTGATAEAISSRLKKAGAKQVYLITVASTPPFDKY